MKKRLLLVLGLASGLVLAGCGEEATSSDTPAESSSVSETVYATGVTIINDTTGETLDSLAVSLTTPVYVSAIVTPTTAADASVTWSVSEEGIIDISNIGFSGAVSGLETGTVTLTATANGAAPGETVSASIEVTVTDYDFLDIADFATDAEGGVVYGFRGILEDLDHTDRYGNAYITDPTTGATLQLYGSTTTESALVQSGSSWTYTNPRDAQTTLADWNNGEWVVGYGLWDSDFSNLKAVMLSHETADYTYTAELASIGEGGTANISKTEGLTYGETVTVTVTPDSGYSVNNVTITTAYGTEIATRQSDGTYTFGTYCVNKVNVTFYQNVEGVISIDLTESSGNLAGFGLSTSYTSATNTIQGVRFDATYCAVNKNSGWDESVLVVGHSASSSATEGGNVILSGFTFTSIRLTYRWWANASTSLFISYSNNGTDWTDIFTETQASNVDYLDDQVFDSTEANETFSASYLRILVRTSETSGTSNRRVGLFNVTLETAD